MGVLINDNGCIYILIVFIMFLKIFFLEDLVFISLVFGIENIRIYVVEL